MLKLTGRFAKALLEYAQEQGMGEIYRQALLLAEDKASLHSQDPPGELGAFLKQVPMDDREAVLFRFLGLAREEMDLLQAEVISAVPLTSQQLAKVEESLIRKLRKQIELTARVDPSLLGGVRIIVGNMVFDSSIKGKLSDMKSSVYKGVYFK